MHIAIKYVNEYIIIVCYIIKQTYKVCMYIYIYMCMCNIDNKIKVLIFIENDMFVVNGTVFNRVNAFYF